MNDTHKPNQERLRVTAGLFVLLFFLFLGCVWKPYWEMRELTRHLAYSLNPPMPFGRYGLLFLSIYAFSLFHHFYLLPNDLLRKRYRRYWLSVIIGLLLLLGVDQLLWQVSSSDRMMVSLNLPKGQPHIIPITSSSFTPELLHRLDVMPLLITLFVLGLSAGYGLGQRYYQEQIARRELERDLAATELTLLRNQIQPHFFFNVLNTIYAMIDRDSDLARQAVYRFARLMRYTLELGEGLVRLDEEIEFLEHYISLQQLRYEQKVVVTWHRHITTTDVRLPAMLLQPLVENAFKYGVHPQAESFITLCIEEAPSQISFSITNRDFSSGLKKREESLGVGLQNVRSRLQRLYRDTFAMHTETTQSLFTITVTIPKCHEPEPPIPLYRPG
ncbi:sensor histidine kinase [Spirosoma soli]|uniref:Sensor histidine kinase n=1 Tax=Spirosoma soli TaxID=1770529 RepID=A0ABW5LZ16_9BACT